MRIATWNVNSLKARLERVEEWVDYAQPDVLCLQETKLADAAFPAMTFQAKGYEAVHHGHGARQGVAILSRVGIEDPVYGLGDAGVEEMASRLISATCGGVRVTSVYVPNGRTLDNPQYAAKLAWLDELAQWLKSSCDPKGKVAVCGDFNVAPDDRDVYDPALFVGNTHTTAEVRAAVQELVDWGLVDSFRRLYDGDRLYSWWDYRAGDFHQGRGLRIDLGLISERLAEGLTWALIDRQARKGKLPSDHAPFLIDVDVDA